MFKLHLQGLGIGNLQRDRMRVGLLNSAVRSHAVPYHVPTLFVPRTALVGTTATPLPSIADRWLTTSTDLNTVGFDLTRMSLRVGVPGTAPTKSTATGGSLEHPVGTPLDWSSLRWVLNASKFIPGGRLRPEFLQHGPDTLTVADVFGGELRGGEPTAAGDAHYIWEVRPGYRQAFTDTLDVVYDAAPEIEILDSDGQSRGTVQLRDDGEAWLINESPERAASMAVPGVGPEAPANDDCFLFLEAFDADERNKAAVNPVPIEPAFSQIGFFFSTAHCDFLLVD